MVEEESESNTALGNEGKTDFSHKLKQCMTSGAFTTNEQTLHAKIHL
jgi:hypothetical protein